jgi:hypothetical protein
VANFLSNAIKFSASGSTVVVSGTVIEQLRVKVPAAMSSSDSIAYEQQHALVTDKEAWYCCLPFASSSSHQDEQDFVGVNADSSNMSHKSPSEDTISPPFQERPATLAQRAVVLQDDAVNPLHPHSHRLPALPSSEAREGPHSGARLSFNRRISDGGAAAGVGSGSSGFTVQVRTLCDVLLDATLNVIDSGVSLLFFLCYQRTIGAVEPMRLLSLADPTLMSLDSSGRASIAIVEIAVTDKGCGLADADALRLFEEFQQVP